MKKKPPESNAGENTHKIFKTKLCKIIKNKNSINILQDAVYRINKIVVHVYQFLRLWILDKYEKGAPIPTLNKDIILMAFKALLTDSVAGKHPTGINAIYYDEFKQFYINTYSKLGYENKIDGTNLKTIIGYIAVNMLTVIENNIKLNFLKYIRRFVNSSFKLDHSNTIKATIPEERYEMRKSLRKELYQIKQDLINNTKNSDQKHHIWIEEHRNKIAPDNLYISQTDIDREPQKYFKNMIYMNLHLENEKRKQFQFFPQRSSIIPKYIPLDTKCIIELLVTKDKQHYLERITELKHTIWDTYFNLNNKIFKTNKYQFDYFMSTDAFAVSLLFVDKNTYERQQEIKNLKSKARKSISEMTDEQKAEYKNKREEKNKAEQIQKEKIVQNRLKFKEEIKNKKQNEKEKYNLMTLKEKKSYNAQKKKEKIQNSIENKKKIEVEFPYIDEIDDNELEQVSKRVVFCDPGKRDLLTMMDKDGKIFRYSNRQRLHETRRLKYQRLLKNYRKKKGIEAKEAILSNFNSKSCKVKNFSEFILEKNKLNDMLRTEYENKIFRQYKWYSYINTKRSEDNLLLNIEKVYGKSDLKNENNSTLNIVMGDWSMKHSLKNFISTPGISLKRKLKEKFKIYNIDEHNTSKLHFETETVCDNFRYPDKKGETRKLHSVLTFTMKNKRLGCINRDLNAVRNMRKLFFHWKTNKEWLDKYKFNKSAKPINVKSAHARKGSITEIKEKTKGKKLKGNEENKVKENEVKKINIPKDKIKNNVPVKNIPKKIQKTIPIKNNKKNLNSKLNSK